MRLSHILDLTSVATRKTLRITRYTLVEANWQFAQEMLGVEASTQIIGRSVRDAGFEALKAPSAVTRGANLVVFPENLRPDSALSIVNAAEL